MNRIRFLPSFGFFELDSFYLLLEGVVEPLPPGGRVAVVAGLAQVHLLQIDLLRRDVEVDDGLLGLLPLFLNLRPVAVLHERVLPNRLFDHIDLVLRVVVRAVLRGTS